MCLGGDARAANKAATRQYVARVETRKRKWKGELDIYKAKSVRYKQNLSNINAGANTAYGRNQIAARRGYEKVLQENLKSLQQFTQNSKAAARLASGATGRSVRRLGVMELGALGKEYAGRAAALTNLYADTAAGSRAVYEKVKNDFRHERAKVAIAPVPGVQIPSPVYRNPGMEGFKEALSIGSSIAGFFPGGKFLGG